jgi:hypothetical protein
VVKKNERGILRNKTPTKVSNYVFKMPALTGGNVFALCMKNGCRSLG